MKGVRAELLALRLPESPGSLACERLEAAVSPERRERCSRFRRREDALRSLAGEALLRAALSRRTGRPGAELRLAENRFGKPCWADGRSDGGGLRFNVSHAGRWVAVLLGGGEVGVDVEQIKPLQPPFPVDCLHPAEARWWRRLPEPERLAAFYELWTLKESYVKAKGMGLSLPLHSFAVQPLEGGGAALAPPDGDCRLRLYPLAEDMRLAGCAIDGSLPSRPEFWTFEQLLERAAPRR